MSNKTKALLGAGYVATLIVGVLLGVVAAKTLLAPTIAITKDEVIDSMQFMVDEGFQTGMMVVEVVESSPAEEAGLVVGDVILSVDGEEINLDHPLAEIIRVYKVGDQIEIQVNHNGEERTLEATLGEHPEDGGLAFLGVVGGPLHARFLRRGFSGEGFRHNREFGMEEGMPFDHPEFDFELMGGPGLVVMHVAEGSPAEESGLLPADIILAVDETEIGDFKQFASIIRSHEPGDGIILSLVRDGEEQELDITLGEHPEEEGRAYLGVMGFGLHEFMPDKLRPGLNFESQG
jgi:S1-C subfamily serine protease